MGTSPINTTVGVVSHAHPLPFRPVPHAQRVRAAVMRVPITVNLHGLLFGRAVTVSDVLMPKIRRTPVNEDGMFSILDTSILTNFYQVNPSHLDVTECWKGLSHAQAGELTMWYHFLYDCLHNEVREALSKEVAKDLLEGEEFDEVYTVPRMLECLRSKSLRIIDISFIDIIDSMMAMFHDQFPNESASLASNWSQFSGGLSLLLHNFLRLQDCFRHSASGPCLEIKFDFQYKEWILMATGNVLWQPPNIRFLHIPSTRTSGELYRITPFVWHEASSPSTSPSRDDYVDQIEYTIPKTALHDITWDAEKRCFKAIVGDFRDGKPHTVETVVMATLTTPFPNSVRLERQSRWSLKLVVTPRHWPLTPDDGSELPTREAALRHLMVTALPGWDQEIVIRNSDRIKARLSSPQKRKVSKPEVVGEVHITKRTCHEPISDRTSNGNESSDDNDQPSRMHVVGSDASGHIISCNQSHSVSTEHKHQYDSGYLSASRSPTTSAHSELSHHAAGHVVLQQQEIIDNYYEFKDRQFFKDAGLISPVSEGERRAYENIFLGDSDEWSPVTEGSSFKLDTIMKES